MLNVERARLDKILTNNELKSLIIALGTNIGEMFDIEKLRYHRIIIMTDADVDGAHFRTLLLTLFFRYFPELITQGHIYIAQPPLYSLKTGKNVQWFYNEEDLDKYLKKQGLSIEDANIEENGEEGEETNENEKKEEKGKQRKLNIQRYKGLGEMNPEQLWNTTMNPATRVLKKIDVEDAIKADSTFEVLMGDEVAPRKKFIQGRAKLAKLDI